MTEPVLHITDVEKSYGGRVALRPLSVDVGAGETVVVIGPNGSGKTTMLKLVAGLLDSSGGAITVSGHRAGSIGARAAVSYIADTPVFYDDISVMEHLEFVARMHDREDWQGWAAELLRDLHVEDRAADLPGQLSRGLRQKVSIALGFVRPFNLLLVDEPFVGLDAHGRRALMTLIDDVSRIGAAVVVVTHQLDDLSWADRCLALSEGRLVYDGPPGEADMGSLGFEP